MTALNKQALKPGLYAILFRNNWDGEGDTYETLASLDSNLIWHNHETGKELFEYEGDAVLKAWLLNDSTTTDALEAKDITLSARDYHFDQDAARIESLEKSLEAAENNLIDSECHVAELEESLRDKQALLEALDNSLCELLPGTQYMDPPDGGSVTPLEQVRRMVADYRGRIEELEARELVVKQFDDFQIVHYGATEDYAKGYIDCQNNYNKALAAAGIGVKGE
ncbi:hypothetical protein [Citrobacter freundii]|uniref:hypothetical protein n=1 Tax=Citrobacter freundii TaxID=546 RepID=UPI003ED7BD6C